MKIYKKENSDKDVLQMYTTYMHTSCTALQISFESIYDYSVTPKKKKKTKNTNSKNNLQSIDLVQKFYFSFYMLIY